MSDPLPQPDSSLEAQPDSPETVISWTAHPARERVGAAMMTLAVMAGFAVMTGMLMGRIWWGALALLVFGLVLNRFFMPSYFDVDDEGVSAHYPLRKQRLAWEDVRRFVTDRNGGFLSRRKVGSTLDAFQGMHVLFGANRDDAIAAIRARLPREATGAAGATVESDDEVADLPERAESHDGETAWAG